MRNTDSITAPVTAPPSDIHQPHHPMAQHTTSHFISKIIITDSAYQEGMDPKHERQSVGTFSSGLSLCFRFIFPSMLQMLRLHEFVCVLWWDAFHGVREASCPNNTALSSISLAVCTTSLVTRTIVWLFANELGVIHATESGTLPGTSCAYNACLVWVFISVFGKTEHSVWMWAPPRVPHYTQAGRQT